MTKFTTEIGFKGFQNPDEVGAAAVDYLRVAGHLVFGYFWARMAQGGAARNRGWQADPFYLAKLQTARFYFAKLFPETAALMRTRPRRHGGADGHGRSAGLRPVTNHDGDTMKSSLMPCCCAQPPAAGAGAGHAGRACGRPSTTRPRPRSRWCASPTAAACSPARSRRSSTDKPDAKCDECTDERKDKPVLGMRSCAASRRADDKDTWDGGDILDPEQRQGLQGAPEAGRRRQEARSARLHRHADARPHPDLAFASSNATSKETCER